MSAPNANTAAGNPYLPHSLRVTTPPPPPPTPLGTLVFGPDGLPIGTAAQILLWVGEDPLKARRAHRREEQLARPRATLLANLRAVIKRNEPAAPLPEPAPVSEEPKVELKQEPLPSEEPAAQIDIAALRKKMGLKASHPAQTEPDSS